MADDSQKLGQPTSYPPYYPQDEISISEIVTILKRRWLLITSIVVLAVVAAGLYLLTTPLIYESRAVIRVGVIGGIPEVSDAQSVEPSSILINRLVEDYRVKDAGRPELPRLDSITKDKADENTIELIAQAYSPEQAQSFLVDVTRKLLDEHGQVFSHAKRLLAGRTDTIRDLKSAIYAELVEIDKQIASLTEKDNSAAALFALEKSRLLEHSLEVEGRITGAEIAQELKSYPSSSLREPTLNPQQVAPKRGLIVILALILGLGVGVVVAFIIEFISSAGRAEHARNDITG